MSDMVYKLFAGTATAADSEATLDIQDDGFIEGVFMDLSATGMDALNDLAQAEVSFMSSNSFTTNDTRGSIMGIKQIQNFLTSGGGVSGRSVYLGLGRGIPVSAGERVHLHVTMSTGVVIAVSVYLYVRVIGGVRASRRRR